VSWQLQQPHSCRSDPKIWTASSRPPDSIRNEDELLQVCDTQVMNGCNRRHPEIWLSGTEQFRSCENTFAVDAVLWIELQVWKQRCKSSAIPLGHLLQWKGETCKFRRKNKWTCKMASKNVCGAHNRRLFLLFFPVWLPFLYWKNKAYLFLEPCVCPAVGIHSDGCRDLRFCSRIASDYWHYRNYGLGDFQYTK